MTTTVILGGGRLGRAIEAAFVERGRERPRVLGRPPGGRHDRAAFDDADVVIDASDGASIGPNVADVLAAGRTRLVLATTGWDADRESVEAALRPAGAAAVVAPNLSLGAAMFLRLVDRAAQLLGPAGTFDPYVIEWHRRGKLDRPSGTAREIVRRLVSSGATRAETAEEVEVAVVRAGSSPGMHHVGFDSAGETIELRLTARDRSAYGAGAIAAVDWLVREPRRPGFHAFDAVVDDLIASRPLAATA